jgi:macrolide transport system ATP-binding/permease protein
MDIYMHAREIGIRMALGPTVSHAMVQIGRFGVGGSVLGLVLGLALCAGVLRVMRRVVYGVGVYDLPTILGVVLVLASVTLIATAVPTLRIASIDPDRLAQAFATRLEETIFFAGTPVALAW